VPDEPSAAGDEVSGLRASNARLRQVVEAKDTEIAALRAALEAARARQDELIRRQAELTRSLELRVAELERRLGMDSGNSSMNHPCYRRVAT
jgi:predicted RNase H-like nuclease (RuvC/YqgF family)